MAELPFDQFTTVFHAARKPQPNLHCEAWNHHQQQDEAGPPDPSANCVRIPSSGTVLQASTALTESHLEGLPCLDYDHKDATFPHGTGHGTGAHMQAAMHDSYEGCQESADACGIHGQLLDYMCSPHGNDIGREVPHAVCYHDPPEGSAHPHASNQDDSNLDLDDESCPYSSSECSSMASVLTIASSQSETDAEESVMDVASVEAHWTDAKHRSYLAFMEANFVHNLYNRKYCAVDVCGGAPCHVQVECAAAPANFWSYSGGREWFTCSRWSMLRNNWVNERSPPLADTSEGQEVDSPMKPGNSLVHEDTEKATTYKTEGLASSRKRGSWPLDEERPPSRQKADKEERLLAIG